MIKLGELLTVVTPSWRTSSGSRGSAWLTRFCTCTCARSASVPTRKVTVSVSTPSEVACDDMYSMFSTPLICSSSGVATASEITRGLAPGYTARTTTDGGTTSGYSLIGSPNIAIRPPMKMMIDRTAAKIGRSMKNRENRMDSALRGGRGGIGHHCRYGRSHLHPWPDAHETVDHD